MTAPRGSGQQFVYSKVVENWPGIGRPIADQQWISVDGTRLGLDKITGGTVNPSPADSVDGSASLQFCRHGLMYDPHLVINHPLPPGTPKSVARGYHPGPRHCTTDETAGYLPDMPTNPNALRAYLLKPPPGEQRMNVVPGALIQMVESTMTTHYLLPQQQAAMYELLAHTPGLTLVPHVANAQGADGIGVRASGYKGGDYTIIFDPKTYAPLGMNWTRLGKPAGEVQVKLAIVDKVGQLP